MKRYLIDEDFMEDIKSAVCYRTELIDRLGAVPVLGSPPPDDFLANLDPRRAEAVVSWIAQVGCQSLFTSPDVIVGIASFLTSVAAHPHCDSEEEKQLTRELVHLCAERLKGHESGFTPGTGDAGGNSGLPPG